MEQVKYECRGENGRVAVMVDVAAVFGTLGEPLAPAVAALFTEAAERAGVPVPTLLDELDELRRIHQGQPNHPFWTIWGGGVEPQPCVMVEAWPSQPQPWPVFVAIGDEIVAEFYPVGIEW